MLSACLRIGYDAAPRPSGDGGYSNQLDAAARFDAAIPSEGGVSMDAASPLDAAVLGMDGSIVVDAGAAADAAPPRAAADAAVSCSTLVTRDYCLSLPALAEPPVLDGALDCGPQLIALTPNGWSALADYEGNHPSRYAAAWRPDGLYFYVEVDDTLLLPARERNVDPWCGDGVELYADADGIFDSAPDFDDPGAIQLIAAAAARDTSMPLAVSARYHTRSAARAGDWSTSSHVVVARENGYALEAFVTAAELELSSWSLSAGAKVGVDIAINVSVSEQDADEALDEDDGDPEDCELNLGQYYLRVSRTPCYLDSCRPPSNAAAFCSPTLE